jgi:hypothetical protein
MGAPVMALELQVTGAPKTANAGLQAASGCSQHPPVLDHGRPSRTVRGENMRFAGRRPEGPALSSDDDPRTVVLSTPRAAVRGLQAGGGGRRWNGRPERHVRLLRAAASGPLDTASGQLGPSRLPSQRGSGRLRGRRQRAAAASPAQSRPARPWSVPWLGPVTSARAGEIASGHVSQIRVYYDRVDVLGQLGESGTAEGNQVLRSCNRSSAGSPEPLMAGLPHGTTGS